MITSLGQCAPKATRATQPRTKSAPHPINRAVRNAPKLNDAITQLLKKCGIIFFYTADKKEVRPWPVPQDSDIVTCAGKIHSDLARGFIKADIITYDDFMQVYNMQEARAKGLVRLVDRDYTIHEGDIIEIRFNV